jgi:hypothetical protein
VLLALEGQLQVEQIAVCVFDAARSLVQLRSSGMRALSHRSLDRPRALERPLRTVAAIRQTMMVLIRIDA